MDQHIADLDPQYFWMGGGRLSLKMGCSIAEFKQYMGKRLIIDAISDPKK